jgi:hypothetical protein
MHGRYYQSKKEAAHRSYSAQPLIHSPFFNEDIVLSPEGFQHLSLSAHGGRTKEEQIRRFILLPLGLHVLKTSTTLQAYRKRLAAVGTPGSSRGLKGTKIVQWWAFVALFLKQDIKVRVVVRKVGGGELHFWSVMLSKKPNKRIAPKYSARAKYERE